MKDLPKISQIFLALTDYVLKLGTCHASMKEFKILTGKLSNVQII